MKKIKKIIAILAVAILLFCNGCFNPQPAPLQMIRCNSKSEFINQMEEKSYGYENKDIFFFEPISNEYEIKLRIVEICIKTFEQREDGRKKYEKHIVEYGVYREEILLAIIETSTYYEDTNRLILLPIEEEGCEVEIDNMKGKFDESQLPDCNVYETVIKNEQDIKFYIRCTTNERFSRKQFSKAEFLTVAEEIVKSRYVIEELKEI